MKTVGGFGLASFVAVLFTLILLVLLKPLQADIVAFLGHVITLTGHG